MPTTPVKVPLTGTGTLGSLLQPVLNLLGLGTTNVIVQVPSTGNITANADTTLAGLLVDANGALNVSGAGTVLNTIGDTVLNGGTTTVGPLAGLDIGTDLNTAAGGVLSVVNGVANVGQDINNTLGNLQVTGQDGVLNATNLVNGVGSTVAATAGSVLNLAGNLTNSGQTTVDSGLMKIVQDIANTGGTLAVGGTGAVLSAANLVNDALGTVGVTDGGQLNLSGLLDNSGAVNVTNGVANVLQDLKNTTGIVTVTGQGAVLNAATLVNDVLGTVNAAAGAVIDTTGSATNGGVLNLADGVAQIGTTLNNTTGTINVIGNDAVAGASNIVNGALGTINVGGGGTTNASGNITNRGRITASDSQGGAIVATNIYNYGLIVNPYQGSTLSMMATQNIVNQTSGTIQAVRGGTVRVMGGNLTNNGLVVAKMGGTVDLSNPLVTTTNLTNGTLTRGEWQSEGAGSTINFGGGPITTLSATRVYLLDPGSKMQSTANGVTTTLEQSLTTLAAGGRLNLFRGHGFASRSSGLTVQKAGRLTLQGGTLAQSGNGLTIDAGGLLTGFGRVSATLHQTGTIQSVGGTLDFTGTGNVINGRWDRDSSISFSAGTDTIQANINVKSIEIGKATLTLASNAHQRFVIRSGNTIDFTGNGSIAAARSSDGFTNGGLLEKTGGTGKSTVDGVIVNNAAINVSSGTLDFTGRINATTNHSGTFGVHKNGRLEFGSAVANNQTIAFGTGSNAGNGTLLLDQANTFRGVVQGFGAGDKIDLSGFGTAGETLSYNANANGSGGTLTVASGTDKAAISFDGQFVAAGFHIASDGHGGTALTYTPPTSQTANLAAAHA